MAQPGAELCRELEPGVTPQAPTTPQPEPCWADSEVLFGAEQSWDKAGAQEAFLREPWGQTG